MPSSPQREGNLAALPLGCHPGGAPCRRVLLGRSDCYNPSDMMFSQAATLLVLAGSTVVLLCATSVLPTTWSTPSRWILRLVIAVLMSAIGILEVPLVGLPFWSRDLSLTWLSMVVALGFVGALVPRLLPPAPGHLIPQRAMHGCPCREAGPPLGLAVTAERDNPPRRTALGRTRLPPVLLAIAVVTISVVLYVISAEQNLVHVNTDLATSDQRSYLHYAAGMRDSGFAHLGDRNRMPVFPFLLALTIERGGASEATFLQAKTVNLVLSIVLLVGCGMVLRRYFDLRWAVLLTEVAAWSLFVFKAPYVQAELLYYALAFGLFVMALELLVRPSAGMAIALGIVAGLAHLTKASVLPGLVLLLAALFVQGILKRARALRAAPAADPPGVLWASTLRYPLLIACFFLLTVFPYIKSSWYRFGHPFYNVNSTFYMWYNSWDEAKAGTRAHGDRVGWPDMPADEIPGPGKYLREHSPAQMADRVFSNAQDTLVVAAGSYGYFKYALVFTVVLLVAVVLNPDRAKMIWRTHPGPVLYVLAFFAAYAVLDSWFRPILDHGNRLVLALYLPFLYICARAVHSLVADGHIEVREFQLRVTDALFLGLTVLVLSDVWAVLVDRSLHMYGGH